MKGVVRSDDILRDPRYGQNSPRNGMLPGLPVSGHGRPRGHPIPDILSVAAEMMLAPERWKKVSWRRGAKGRLTARFAALRLRIADGTPQRILDKGQQHSRIFETWIGAKLAPTLSPGDVGILDNVGFHKSERA